jgi:hypothetical protein
MTKLENAARSFFTLQECSRLLALAHSEQREWTSEVKANTIDGSDGKPERNQDGMPKLTGGYEIHIIIHPPTGVPGASAD